MAVNSINNYFNDYYQRKGGYDESQSSIKEFMLKLTSKHDNIELDGVYLLYNRSSEKYGGLISNSLPLKVNNGISTRTPKRLNQNILCLSGLWFFSQSVHAKLI